MRYIIDLNSNKRGCEICADVVKAKRHYNGETTYPKACPYDECPYHELDDVKNYSEYDKRMKKLGGNIIDELAKKILALSEK